MPIPDFARKNFNTLIRAAKDDRLALMECVDAQTGAARYVLCAVNKENPVFMETYVSLFAFDRRERQRTSDTM